LADYSIIVALSFAAVGACMAAGPEAVRLPQDPLITLEISKSPGDNINGPSVIRVPGWITDGPLLSLFRSP
jgi:hypothetical protein